MKIAPTTATFMGMFGLGGIGKAFRSTVCQRMCLGAGIGLKDVLQPAPFFVVEA
jgi:hypothetical protein